MWVFLTMPLVGLQSVIAVFPDYTHLLFCREEPRSSLVSGVIENLESDLIWFSRSFKNIFSRHLGFRDHIHEFGRKSLLH